MAVIENDDDEAAGRVEDWLDALDALVADYAVDVMEGEGS